VAFPPVFWRNRTIFAETMPTCNQLNFLRSSTNLELSESRILRNPVLVAKMPRDGGFVPKDARSSYKINRYYSLKLHLTELVL